MKPQITIWVPNCLDSSSYDCKDLMAQHKRGLWFPVPSLLWNWLHTRLKLQFLPVCSWLEGEGLGWQTRCADTCPQFSFVHIHGLGHKSGSASERLLISEEKILKRWWICTRSLGWWYQPRMVLDKMCGQQARKHPGWFYFWKYFSCHIRGSLDCPVTRW